MESLGSHIIVEPDIETLESINSDREKYRGYCFIVHCNKKEWYSRNNRIILDMVKIRLHLDWSFAFTANYADMDKHLRPFVKSVGGGGKETE